jgi:transcriptional regulator with XRE-family HTH domain
MHYCEPFSDTRAYAGENGVTGHFGWRDAGYAGRRRNERAAKRGRLAQRRKAVGLTQEQLAEQLGVERTTVLRWERGQTQPQPWLRPRLAKTLGVSADRIEELLVAAPASAVGRAAAVPRQLPASVTDFTGRAVELQALTRMLDQAGADAPGTVVISAIANRRGGQDRAGAALGTSDRRPVR